MNGEQTWVGIDSNKKQYFVIESINDKKYLSCYRLESKELVSRIEVVKVVSTYNFYTNERD